VRQLITEAQAVLDKTDATESEVETAIAKLKTLSSANAGTIQKEVWEEKKDANQKLLTDLEAKLTKLKKPEPEKEKRTPPYTPPQTPPGSPGPEKEENEKKFGTDFNNLQPTQQEGRKKIVENWKRETNYSRSLVCSYCPEEFSYDHDLEFLNARQKAETERDNHENNCSNKNNSTQQKEVKQNK